MNTTYTDSKMEQKQKDSKDMYNVYKIITIFQFKKLRVLDLSCNYIPKIENLNENGVRYNY